MSLSKLTENPSQIDNLPERRIVLLGKSGVGKSASGNTILGRKAFKSESGFASVTSKCKKEESVVSGKQVSVIDTPGFFDTNMSEGDLAVEIGRSIYLSQPGVHVFLFVIRLDLRFTKQEEDVIKKMEIVFGPRAKEYTILLFTHGDKLGPKNIGQEIKKIPALSNLVERFGGRYHVFNNEEMTNRVQVSELMEKMDKMLKKNNGKCFWLVTKMPDLLMFLSQNWETLLKIAKAILITVGSTAGGPMGAVIAAGAAGAVEGAVNAQAGETLMGAVKGAAGGAVEGALHAVVSKPVERVLSGVLKETAVGAVRGAVREAAVEASKAPEGSRQVAALKGAGEGAVIGAAGGLIGGAAVAVGPTVVEAARPAGNAVVRAGEAALRIPEGAGTGFTVNVVMVLNLFRLALGPRSPEN